jgi:hypothetical protein
MGMEESESDWKGRGGDGTGVEDEVRRCWEGLGDVRVSVLVNRE